MSTTQEKINDVADAAAEQIVVMSRVTAGDHGHVAEAATCFLVSLESHMVDRGFTEAEVNDLLIYVLRSIAERMSDDDWRGW